MVAASIKTAIANAGEENPINASGSAKILLILPYPPNPLRPRSASVLNDLCSFAKVDLIYLDHGEKARLPSDVNIQSVTVLPNGQISRLFRLATGCLRGRPFSYQYYHSASLVSHLRFRDLSDYSAIYIEKISLNELPIDHPNVVFDVVDCCTQQVRQCASKWPGPRRFLYKLDSFVIGEYEARLCNRATKVICTAEREAEGLRSIGVLRPILVLPHASNAVEFKRRTVREQRKKVLSFHGKLSYVANRLALMKISRVLIPNLDAESYEVQVAGAGAEKLKALHPRIKFVGFVEDIVGHLRSADLSIFPIEISAGLSNKILESLAAGVPAIATPQVAAGLPDISNLLERGIFVREISDFRETIHSYFRIPIEGRQKISDECVNYVESLQVPERRRALLRNYILSDALSPEKAQSSILSGASHDATAAKAHSRAQTSPAR